MKNKLFVSFSGGETSASMCGILQCSGFDDYDITYIFANTGQENEETLEFIEKCDKLFKLNVVWIEAVVSPIKGKGVRHKIVDFESASRRGEPFEELIKKEGIPNRTSPHCSSRLKNLPINDYIKSTGAQNYKIAIGMRADEPNRILSKIKRDTLNLIGIDPDEWRMLDKISRLSKLQRAEKILLHINNNFKTQKERDIFNRKIDSLKNHKNNIIYPLCDFVQYDKQDVNSFWEDQDFRLELEDHEGNCKTCWKKSDKKLWLIAIESPERFDFMRDMERKYKNVNPKRQEFFRGKRTTIDLFNQSKELDAITLRMMIKSRNDSTSGCGESCEPYQEDFFIDTDYNATDF